MTKEVEKLPCTWPRSSDETLTVTEAVRKLESYGLRPSLACNGTGFLRQVATIIAELEINPFKTINVKELKDGDVLVVQSDDLDQTELDRLKQGLTGLLRGESGGSKRLAVVGINSSTDIYTVTGEDRQRLLEILQKSGTS